MEENINIPDLFDRYRKGELTAEEKQLINSWLLQLEAINEPLPDKRVADHKQRSATMLRSRLSGREKKIGNWLYWAAAACLLAVIGLPFLHIKDQPQLPLAAITTSGNKSCLHLEDGTNIYLDNITDSCLTLKDGVQLYIHNQEIRYVKAPGFDHHVLITAKGKRYKIILPDQSRVWVNAGSKIRYPVQFAGKQRQTEISGEAYFEVSHAENRPFTVKLPGDEMIVRVLGTSFNVSGSKDMIQTTLVKGKVALDIAGRCMVLQPSQKATYTLPDKKIQVQHVNIDRETDWVYNRLVFREAAMSDVLKRLSDFYNVSFEIKDTLIYQNKFTGTFEDKPLERILDYMEFTSKIHYTIIKKQEGPTIVQLH